MAVPSETITTTVLVAQSRKTGLTTTANYVAREVRDMALKSGMERGVAASYDRLDKILASSKSAGA